MFGRDRELADCSAALRSAAGGVGATMVLTGEPGSGKSTMLDALAAAADGFTVLRCAGTRMESQLPYAGVHELVWPIIDRVGDLPDAQATALGTALGLRAAAPGMTGADRFMVGAALLTLLSEVGQLSPVLLLVDDAHLLDGASAETLSFVARRIGHDAVVVALATPDWDLGVFDARWTVRVPLAGLDDDSARTLLLAHRPELTSRELDAIRRVAEGNPLALRTLPPPVDDLPPIHTIPVGERLRAGFAAAISDQPVVLRTQVLVVAAQEGATIHQVRAVVERLGATPWSVEALETAGLARADGDRIRLRSRLLRSVAYDEAPKEERRRVHAAWAEQLRGAENADLRAWHLAAVAVPPCDALADLLDGTARRAHERGGPRAAAAALRVAATMTSHPAAAGRRMARGARALWESGASAQARDLLAEAERLLGPAIGPISGGLAGMMEFSGGDCAKGYAMLIEVAHVKEDVDSVRLPAVVALRAGWAAGLLDLDDESALGVVLHDLDPAIRRWTGELLNGWRGNDLLTALSEDSPAGAAASPAWMLPPAPYSAVWGISRAVEDAYRREAVRARSTGSTSALAYTLSQLATVDLLGGRWAQAAAHATEALEAAELAGIDSAAAQCHNSLAWLAALRGDVTATKRLTENSIETGERSNVAALVAAATWHRGVACLVTGEAGEALDILRRIRVPNTVEHHVTFAVLAAPDAVEAAVRAGDLDEAGAQIDLLRRWAEHSQAAWARSAYLRSAALVAHDDEAEKLFRDALAISDSANRPFQHAHTELLYGEWLRRHRRRQDSRAHLTTAKATFERLGSHPLLRRAEEGLDLATRAPRQRTTAWSESLTAQELRVARLAAMGGTNREIAAQLFISPRTVGHHLSAVFAKLGISARTELAGYGLRD